MARNRAQAESFGRRAEWAAALWLQFQGWRILARRVRIGAGEVDLVARRGAVLAFVEVKARRDARDLDTAIDAWRLRRVAAAASALAPRYQRQGDAIRVDVILISPWALPRRLENVWQP